MALKAFKIFISGMICIKAKMITIGISIRFGRGKKQSKKKKYAELVTVLLGKKVTGNEPKRKHEI